MWNILPKKTPTFELKLEGPTGREVDEQQTAERHALTVEHVKRLKPLKETLSKLPYPAGDTMRNREAELNRQIEDENTRHRAAFEELSAKHQRINEARAQRLSAAFSAFIVPQLLGWLQDGKRHWLERLAEYHPKLKEASVYMTGHELPQTLYTYRLAEAMLLKNGPGKRSDYAHGLANVSAYDLMAALDAGDPVRIADALHVMERVLRNVNRGLAPIENATYAWRRRMVCDYVAF